MYSIEWYIERVKALEDERTVFNDLLRAIDHNNTPQQTEVHQQINALREENNRLKQALVAAETSLYETKFKAAASQDEANQEDIHHLVFERVSILQRERDAARTHAMDLEATVAAADERLIHLQTALRRTAKDCLNARFKKETAENAALQAREAAMRTNQLLRDVQSQAKHKANLAEQHATEVAKREISTFQQRLKERETTIKTLTADHDAVKSSLEKRLQTLEEAVKVAVRRHRQLHHQRARDVEGWNADLAATRRRIHAADTRLRQVVAIAAAPDEDLADVVAARWNKVFQQECGNEVHSECRSLDGKHAAVDLGALAHELAVVRAGLNGMEQRITTTKRRP